MHRLSFAFALLSVLGLGNIQAPAAQEPSGTAELTVTVVLIDTDLKPRPVPKHSLLLKCANVTPVRLVTGFDGVARVMVPVGQCVLESEKATEFQQKNYRWSIPLALTAGGRFSVELSNDNALTEQVVRAASGPDFPRLFREWQGSVVTVWSESGHGSGFLVDPSGLFLTNDHVVHGSDYIGVQFDSRTKVRGEVLAASPEQDIAVVRVNVAVLGERKPVVLASAADLSRPREGEAVFTIGSPIHQQKVMTTGIVSKVEKTAIISDVNINHGNSGGPLFDAEGKVLGITTFGDISSQGGPGISGVVRIDLAAPIIAEAMKTMVSTPKPPADLLPVEPSEPYPAAALKQALEGRAFKTFEDDLYAFSMGDFDVVFQTPILNAGMGAIQSQMMHEAQSKREKKAGKAPAGNAALAELRDWMQYVGENSPVFVVRVAPKLKEGFWSGLNRGLAASQGHYGGPAKLNFATDFVSMKLYCGASLVQPIQPNRVEVEQDIHNLNVSVRDVAYYGFYTYAQDAIGPQCGQVRLEISSLKKKGAPEVKVVPPKVVERVWSDFVPYRAAVGSEAGMAAKTSPVPEH
jgi:S1-C subfamily serine protease